MLVQDNINHEWLSVLDFQPAFDILNKLQANSETFAPELSNVLRVFQTPPTQVRVVIVGQDPYPTLGDANGLALSLIHI